MQASNSIMAVFQFKDGTRQLFEGTVRPLVETHTGLKYVDATSYYAALTIKMDLISRMIAEARLVIVDISAMNPNVFIELGIAYAMNKPIVLICSKKAWEGKGLGKWDHKLPFDLQGRELLIFRDTNDLKVKLGKHISDSLFATREVAALWDSRSEMNHVKSPSEIEIFQHGRIWSSAPVNSSFTASYGVKIHAMNEQGSSNPDVRFYISISPEKYPCIVVVFPWEDSQIDPSRYECHIAYFPGTGEGSLTPNTGRYHRIRKDDPYDGRRAHCFRLQQVSVAPKKVGSAVDFDVFVSFYWPNLVIESTLFEDRIDRLCVRAYPNNP